MRTLARSLPLTALLVALAGAGAAQDANSYPVSSSADAYLLQQGQVSAGGLAQLARADGDPLVIDASANRVVLLADTTLPTRFPQRVGLEVIAEVFGGNATQRVSLCDRWTGIFVAVDVQDVAIDRRSALTLAPQIDPGRYFDPLTRTMTVRLEYDWVGPAAPPRIELDRLRWITHVPMEQQAIDLRGYPAPSLNTGAAWIRTVFPLGPDRMLGTPDGVQLSIDAAGPGPFHYLFRAELREANNLTFPPDGTSQVYRARFEIDELPDLYGPVTIFQRFSTANNGPDIEVELTGANQFFNAVPNDLQVVAFGHRERTGVFLRPKNDLAVAIHNAQDGRYKVSLNGATLYEATGVDTRAAVTGSWTQFGVYPHGLQDPQNRADQVASGFTRVSLVYASYSKIDLLGEVNLDEVTTIDPN